MADLQHPDIVGNYLGTLYQAQDRQAQKQRQARQDQMTEQQFDMQMDEHQFKQAMQRRDLIARAAFAFDTPEKWAAGVPQVMRELGINGPLPGFDQRERIISEAQTIGDQLEQQWKQKNFALQQRVADANIRQSDAAAAASNRVANAPKGIDPNTGAKTPPPGVQQQDYRTLKEYGASSDAAASIAATLSNAKTALDQNMTGPGSGAKRNIAGVLSLLPDLGVEQFLTGSNHSADIINNYDVVDQAAKISGIEALKGIGGSDTERELLTAIQTGVNNDVLPEENRRRVRNQLAAAEILSTRSQLATEWVNKFGSLSYAAPNGTTWPGFWKGYQQNAWEEHRKREAEIEAKKNGGQRKSVIDAADAILSKPRGRSDGR